MIEICGVLVLVALGCAALAVVGVLAKMVFQIALLPLALLVGLAKLVAGLVVAALVVALLPVLVAVAALVAVLALPLVVLGAGVAVLAAIVG